MAASNRTVFMAGKLQKQGGLSGRMASRNVQVVPGLLLYSQVFRPGKAKIMLAGARLMTDATNDRVFIVQEPAHEDPDKKGKQNPQKDHRFMTPNRASRDDWLRALNQAMAAGMGGLTQGAPLPAPAPAGTVGSGGAWGSRPLTHAPAPSPGHQKLVLVIPPGVRPGQSFMFRALGQTFSSTCPQGKGPGDRLEVTIPVPQQQQQTQTQAAAAAAAAAAGRASSAYPQPVSGRYPTPAGASPAQQQQQPVVRPRVQVRAQPQAPAPAPPARIRVRAVVGSPGPPPAAATVPATRDASAPTFHAGPDAAASDQEALDLARALAASLADAPAAAPAAAAGASLTQPPTQRMPSMNPEWANSVSAPAPAPAPASDYSAVNPAWAAAAAAGGGGGDAGGGSGSGSGGGDDMDDDLRRALAASMLDTGGVPETLERQDSFGAPPSYSEAIAAEHVMSPPHHQHHHVGSQAHGGVPASTLASASSLPPRGPEGSPRSRPAHPLEFLCPITGQLFDDPVVTPAGHSFSRQAVIARIRTEGDCPVTGAPLEEEDLYENTLLAEIVADYRDEALDETGQPKTRSLREAAASSIQHRYSTLCDTGREPIEHLTDPITFELFVEPVVTKYGRTYSRATILDCIAREGHDPFVQRALSEDDPLYPNLAVQTMLDIYEAGPTTPAFSPAPSSYGTDTSRPSEAGGGGGGSGATAWSLPPAYGLPPPPASAAGGAAAAPAGLPAGVGLGGHSHGTVQLVAETCRAFSPGSGDASDGMVPRVLETLTPPLLATLREICGRDERFVIMSFLQNGLDLQRTQDFIVDTLSATS